MIEFNRKLELLDSVAKYKIIRHFLESAEFLNLINEEKDFICSSIKVSSEFASRKENINLTDDKKEKFCLMSNYQRVKDDDIPRTIFRYDSKKHAKESLNSKNIHLSTIDTFNDPFEGILHGDYENATNDEIAKFFLGRGEIKATSTNKRKFINENITERKKLIEEIKVTHELSVLSTGVFCCSEVPDNITMWAHYSENHKSVCLEYDVLRDPLAFDFINRIDYVNEYPPKATLTEMLKDKEQYLLKISLLTKSKIWGNEKEIRLIKAGKIGKLLINPDCLKSIIFGLKCRKKDRDEFIKILKENKYSCETEIKEAVKAENKYKLEIKTIGTLKDF